MIRTFTLLTVSAATLALSACGGNSWFGEDEPAPLSGDRQAVLIQQPSSTTLSADLTVIDASRESAQTELAPVWNNAFWPQAGGYANHAMQHVALVYPLKRLWSRSIGKGETRSLPLISQPVVGEGVIATLDTKGQVKALNADTGSVLWSTDIRVEDEDERVIGGGLAIDSGLIVATAGYNEAIALSITDGAILWRASLSAPARSAPTLADGRAFVVTLDNRTTALSLADGSRLWQHQGLEEAAGLLGMASPAFSNGVVFSGLSSGEIYALRAENGSSVWSDNLSALTRRGSRASLSDIRAHPVVDKGLVFVVSTGGRTVAIDERTGQRLWDVNRGGAHAPFVSGNRVFMIDLNKNLISLDRMTGRTVWETQLPAFEDMEDREDPIVWNGPILAGNLLLAVSSDGGALVIDPISGVMEELDGISVETTIAPVVAGGRLLLLSRSGQLSQYE